MRELINGLMRKLECGTLFGQNFEFNVPRLYERQVASYLKNRDTLAHYQHISATSSNRWVVLTFEPISSTR